MRTSRSTLRSALAAVTVAAAMTAGAGAAVADQQDAPKEDPRAVVHDGNAKKCEDVGAAGHVIDKADLSSKLTPRENEQDRRLVIKSVRDGAKITAIVVKGGNGYNVYVPGNRELPMEPSWKELRAPLNGGGKIPAISHWYACWVHANPETADNPPTTDTTTSTPGTETSTPTESETSTTTPGETTTTEGTTSSPSSSQPVAPTVTSTTEAVPAVSSDDTENLAHTGFNNAWLIWLGGALVLAGAAALVLLRVRRSRS